MPKPRADSKLASLPENQREMLRRWLVDENLSYGAARERLREDFGVETSERALSVFYAKECFSDRFAQARDFADKVAAEVQEGADKFDDATISLIKQKAFERAVAKDGDLKELQILAGIIGDTAKLRIKQQEVELAERRIALLEKKAAEADAAREVAGDAALSAEEKEARIKAVFGLR